LRKSWKEKKGKRNLIIKRIEIKERKRKEVVKRIRKTMGIEEVKIEEIWGSIERIRKGRK